MILSQLSHRFLALAGSLTIAAAGLVGAAAPAQATACSGTNGVTVVVQSSAGTSTKCASGDPSSALAALRDSGHSVTFVRNQPGFICQIDGFPNVTCATPPPLDAYWAFFHGPAGGSWTYSQSGAGSYNPRPGSSVGFRFGSGSAPSVRPAAPAPAPKPTTAKPKPTTAAPRPTTAAPRSTTTAPRGTTAPAPTSEAARSAATAASPAASAAASARASASASASASALAASPSASPTTSATSDVSAQKPSTTSSGSSGRLVGGGVLLLALATAVGAVALRRRQAAAASSATPTDTPTP